MESPCYFCLAQLAAASLAAFTIGTAPEALEGHAFAVSWKRGTLVASLSRAEGSRGLGKA
eukprot:6587472-Prymnesium_polylepis.1